MSVHLSIVSIKFQNVPDFVCLILFFTSHPQSFSYVGTGYPGLNDFKIRLAQGHNAVTPASLETV